MADPTYGPKVYHKQGGDELVVASGGAITVESGGTITVGGVDLIDELGALNGLDATELGYLNGTTPGTTAANKAVVPNADNNIGVAKVTQLHIGATGAETQVTATATQINATAVTTAGVAEANKTAVLGATKNLDELSIDPGGMKSDGVAVSPMKWVDVAVTAALLDAAGTVNVIAGVAGDQYKVRDVVLVGGGTNFGAGGDRLIDLTDGTTVWTTIANADIEAAPAASLRWGDTKVPFLTGTSATASADGQAIYFVYSGGTTDHGGVGSITFSVCLEKVA